LSKLCETTSSMIFGNRGKAVSEENVTSLRNSLMLINVNNYNIYEKAYQENSNKRQVRINFQYKNTSYDLPITDPIFLEKYKLNMDILDKSNVYLALSLAVVHDGWHYKLVAGIITPTLI